MKEACKQKTLIPQPEELAKAFLGQKGTQAVESQSGFQ